MGNRKYDKLKASFEASQPQLPPDFTNRIMKRVEHKPIALQWHWVTVAACLLFVIGVGFMMTPQEEPLHVNNITLPSIESPKVDQHQQGEPSSTNPINKIFVHDKQIIRTQQTDVQTEEDTILPSLPDPNIHYAARIQIEDTIVYQAPSRVDEFIAKLANFNKVKAVPLDCNAGTGDTTIVSTAYLFPDDEQKIDVFGRLLQVACTYNCKSPGYLLNFSNHQFFFCLNDLRKGEKYFWVAERVAGDRILLFSTHSPIDTIVSSTCFKEYREQLTHTSSNMLNL